MCDMCRQNNQGCCSNNSIFDSNGIWIIIGAIVVIWLLSSSGTCNNCC